MDSPEEALATVEAHLSENPDDASAWNVKGVLQAQKEHFGDALRSFDRAISLDPGLSAAHSNKGRVLMALGSEKASEALRSFETALKLNPDDVQILHDKAQSLRALGRSEAELECYKKLSELVGAEWGVWLRKGDIELELGLFDSALNSFNRALELKEDLTSAYVHKAIALTMLERFGEALKSAKKATKTDPRNIEAWLILGDVNIRAEKYKAAIKALERASDLDPTDASVQNTMGMICYKQGRLKDAVRYLRLAVGRRRKYTTALRNLGLILMELEEWSEARDVLTRLSSIVTDDPDVYDALATAHARMDYFCPAHEAWEKARKLYKRKGNQNDADRVTVLGRAARINCSRQKKALKEKKEREKMQRRFSDRHALRRKKMK
ncbi:MAG: tetratricopeptide repeat protein [Candidatus Thorarchaeota archaeon]